MWRFAPYILKSLRGHATRTMLTVSGSAVAMFVFTFVGSVQGGLSNLLNDPDAKQRLIVFQANRFCPFTSRLPEDYQQRIEELPAVAEAVPIQVFMNNCRASLDVVVFHGTQKKKLKAIRDFQMTAGNWDDFLKRRDGAIVGRALANRRTDVQLGKTLSIGDVTVTVVGIYTTPTPEEENYVYTDLEFLQRTRSINAQGTVTQFEVMLHANTSPETAAREIDTIFRSGQVETDTRPKGAFEMKAVGDLVELIGFSNYLGYACVALVLALVATTTMMTVQDRVREHAVLQTIGFSGSRIFILVLFETMIVSLVGGIAGTSLALVGLSWSNLAVATEGVTIAFTPSWRLAVTGGLVSIVVGLLAGVLPAFQAARAEIVTSLRAV